MKYLLSCLLLSTLALGAVESTPVTADFGAVLREQLARYPELELEDCYKLVHQASLGSEHAVSDPAAARRWMEREIANLQSGPAEPMIDPIAPDGRIVRVNLRPFLAAKGDPQRLVDAFVQTAARPAGTPADLALAWAEVVKLAESGTLPFPAAAVRDYGQRQAAAGWPAVHHSAKYSRLYHPAYRVIAREYLTEALPANPVNGHRDP